MKKSTKKFLVILSCCLLSCSATALAGCDLGSTGPTILPGSQETEKTAISFSTLEKSMVVGDEEYLIPNYKKLDGYSMSYESSDPSVVSVNNDGKISAMTEGIASLKFTSLFLINRKVTSAVPQALDILLVATA